MEDPNISQRAFWTEWGDKYADEMASVHRYGDIKELEKIVMHIIEKLEIKGNDRVLDAGCGSGIFTSILEGLTGADITGMDFSIRHLEIMRKKHIHIEPVTGDVTALPFKEDSFDKVVCYSVLQFVEPWQEAVEELIRVTKRGGMLLLGDIPDRSRRWVQYLLTIKKALILLGRPKEFLDKLRYATSGPQWQWFNISEVISFIKNHGCMVRSIKQPVNSQWGTESYRYRIDLLVYTG